MTIGTGGPGRLALRPAACNRRQFRVYAEGPGASIGVLCPVPLTGKLIAPPRASRNSQDGSLAVTASVSGPCGTTSACSLIVTSSLGARRHRHLPRARY